MTYKLFHLFSLETENYFYFKISLTDVIQALPEKLPKLTFQSKRTRAIPGHLCFPIQS